MMGRADNCGSSASINFPLVYLLRINILCTAREQNGYVSPYDEKLRWKQLFLLLCSSGLFPTLPSSGKPKSKNLYDEKRLLEQNNRVQRENNAPEDFPSFVREELSLEYGLVIDPLSRPKVLNREKINITGVCIRAEQPDRTLSAFSTVEEYSEKAGFEVKVVASENFVKRDSGLIYRDFEVVFRQGFCKYFCEINKVTFHYIGYNESGRHIDSTYLQGRPAKIRFGINGLVPAKRRMLMQGLIGDMRPVGKRRIIIPPELGPPVGPSTPFSAKQFEVFDVELLDVKDCQRRTIGFHSDIVCN
ncbi:hypothetical protein RJ640_010009 [Escallonia rubra]|uniref:peptidylprolyl isomerase n=1 Tax=Escallonia rubra TaxID=112253 RepID=A0AA88QPP2_9ASTE|nr:hypothetical protein RJ640_010009 [Escallonia rubra]